MNAFDQEKEVDSTTKDRDHHSNQRLDDTRITSWLNKDFDLVETSDDPITSTEELTDETEFIYAHDLTTDDNYEPNISLLTQSNRFSKEQSTSSEKQEKEISIKPKLPLNEPIKDYLTSKLDEPNVDTFLNRNQSKTDSTEHENFKGTSEKSYYLPSFLTFFIILLMIIAILLYYSSTYL